jgi:hypothetical protein
MWVIHTARLWDLDPVRSIPQRHWAPLAPPPSVRRAGLLAPLAGAAWLSFMGLASHLLLLRKRDQSSTPCRLFPTHARSSQHNPQIGARSVFRLVEEVHPVARPVGGFTPSQLDSHQASWTLTSPAAILVYL